MGVFSDISESKIFKDEEVLSTDYVPDILPHRENEIKQIAKNILPLSKGRKAQNTFVYGPPGIGKTSVVKNVFREFEDFSEQVRGIYINCWDFRTPTALLTQIIIELGQFVQRRGWSRDEIMQKLTETLKKRVKGLVICLDEVDQLEMSAIYDLLRIEQYVDTPVGLIFISNDRFVFFKAEPRIRSSLGIEEIEFKPYNHAEMKDILTERAKHAFRSFDQSVITLCSNHAVSKGGDVRIGLQCLLKAGRLADNRGSSKVEVDDAKTVMKDIGKVKPEILKEKINEHEKILLEAIEDGKKYSSGELYEKYKKIAEERFKDDGEIEPVTDRSLRDFVNHLNEIGLLEISDKKVGKSRLIWIK